MDFRKLLDPFWGFTLKIVLGIHDPRISWLLFGTKNHEMRGPPIPNNCNSRETLGQGTRKTMSLHKLLALNLFHLATEAHTIIILNHTSEFMEKTFQAAQLTHFWPLITDPDHSCKIFFWYLPNWTSTDLWCVVLYYT